MGSLDCDGFCAAHRGATCAPANAIKVTAAKAPTTLRIHSPTGSRAAGPRSGARSVAEVQNQNEIVRPGRLCERTIKRGTRCLGTSQSWAFCSLTGTSELADLAPTILPQHSRCTSINGRSGEGRSGLGRTANLAAQNLCSSHGVTDWWSSVAFCRSPAASIALPCRSSAFASPSWACGYFGSKLTASR